MTPIAMLWNALKSRWLWIGLTVILSLLVAQKPRVVIQDRIVKQEVIKWKVKASVTGGSTFVDSSGNITNVGGTVVVGSEGSSTTATTTTHSEKPAEKWKVMGGLSAIYPDPVWQVSVSYHIGHILFLDYGLGGIIQTTSLTDFAPDKFGAGVVVSF